jgi:hypothetical protein
MIAFAQEQRWESLRGAYEIRAGVRVDKLRILLVDDVLTTDATLDAYSRVPVDRGAPAVLGVKAAGVISGWTLSGPRSGGQSTKGGKPAGCGEHP